MHLKVKYPEMTVFCLAWQKDITFHACEHCKEMYLIEGVIECKLLHDPYV